MSLRLPAASIEREGVRLTPQGLQLREGITFDVWMKMGRRINEISNASSWWLGDWLVYGQQSFRDRYRVALEATGLDYQTLRNYAWVARRFRMSRRRDALTLQHHAEVAALPEPDQDLWLRRAERMRWSRNELRRHLLEARRLQSGAGNDHRVTCRLEVACGREQRWREAAELTDQPLVDWMVSAVDAAADAVLLARPGQSSAPSPPSPTMTRNRDASSPQPGPAAR
jgi:hypothetical protein